MAAHPGLVQASYGDIKGYTLLSYSDMSFNDTAVPEANWDQTFEFRVSPDGRYAYTSHQQGFSILDVHNPNRPTVISRVRNARDLSCPPLFRVLTLAIRVSRLLHTRHV